MATERFAADDDSAWGTIARHWSFAPGVTFLNHGSFGAAPRAVLEQRAELLARVNRDPVDFFLRFLQPALAAVRERLAAFLHAGADDFALVDNATVAMNAVARSVPLAAGEEVLTTDHEYGAVMRIWEDACRLAGARLVVQPLPAPLVDPQECVARLFAAATPRTRLVVASHVTSPTAVTLPVAAICAAARSRGIPTCIDGPHALVTEPVDLAALDCDYYTASCHKWMLTPVGAGLLYVHPRAQATVRPAIVSWGRTVGAAPSWRDGFNWTGTRDATAVLTLPTALDFIAGVGLEALRARCHHLARLARARIEALTGRPALVPDDPRWYGAMISMPLPAGEAAPLQEALWERYQVEAPVFEWQAQRLVRVSCPLYTAPTDIDRLVTALADLLDLR